MTSPPSPQPKQCQNCRAGVTWKDGRLLVVEGAQTLERAAAGGPEGDVGGDHVVDARLLAHLGDVSSRIRPATSRSLRAGVERQ